MSKWLSRLNIFIVTQHLYRDLTFIPGCAMIEKMLVATRKLTTSGELLQWITLSEASKALQASESSELFNTMRASCGISAEH